MTDVTPAAPAAAPAAAPTPAAEPLNLDGLAAMFKTPEPGADAPAPSQTRDPATGRFAPKEPKPGEPAAAAADATAQQQPEQTPESESAKPDGDATDPENIEIEDGESEPGKTPAIDPPASWSAEDKAAFAKLPPEAQRVVAARESERERHFTAKTTELAEARKKFEAEVEPERAKVRTHLEQLQQALQHYTAPKLAEFRKEFADVISGKVTPLQLADPNGQHRYAEDGTDRYERFQAYQHEFAQMQRTAERVNQELTGQKKAEFEKFRETETAKYREQHKLDDAAWDAHNEALTSFAEGLGFKAEELAYADARHMNVLRAAMEAGNGSKANAEFSAFVKELGLKDFSLSPMEAAKRYASALAAKRKAEANPQQPPVPKVAKPGVSQPQPGALEAKKSAFKSATSKTMDVDGLAKAFKIAS